MGEAGARKEEREACARIADSCAAEMRSQYYQDFWPVSWYMMRVAERIAGEIRKVRGPREAGERG